MTSIRHWVLAAAASVLAALCAPVAEAGISRPASPPTSAQPTGSATGGEIAGPKSTPRITAELVPMSRWATPGSTAIVAVRQQIAPGWHTYWRNPGDSGGATTLTWRLPTGVEAGPIAWPVPDRQRLQGLMNFGYEGEVFLPVPLEIPADARPGSTVPLRVSALFLVCNPEMCVPDQLELALDLPVANGVAPADGRHGAAIQRTLAAVPGPGEIAARLTAAGGRLTLSATGEALGEARRAWFFPFDGGQVDHAAVQPGERGPDGLTLSLTPGGARRMGDPTRPLSGLLWTDAGAWEITATPGAALPGAAGQGALADPDADAGASLGLPLAVGFAFLGGLILNLMPCVFPILAMKGAGLAAGAGAPGHARRDGLGFMTGVLATFLLLAGAMIALRAGGQAIGWGFQLQNPWITGGLALLMLAVGLNLSGVFHVGGRAQAAAGAVPAPAGDPALRGFLTGALAVVVAAPCTAPFMAAALGAALTMPPAATLSVFAALGLGFALPYVALSLSPAVQGRLPRPGPWMARLQRWLAIPVYLTALWLAWVLARQAGVAAVVALAVAGALLALGLVLLGRPERRRLMLAGAAAPLAAVALVAALWPAASGAGASGGEGPPAMAWSPAAVEAARAAGRPVFVNFTADWCLTCKVNERAALSNGRTAAAFERANAVYMVADWTRRDAAIAAELERHGRSGVPLYLVYAPGAAEPRVLPQILTPGAVSAALTDPDPPSKGDVS